jgi:predicted nucleic acid-binding protein
MFSYLTKKGNYNLKNKIVSIPKESLFYTIITYFETKQYLKYLLNEDRCEELEYMLNYFPCLELKKEISSTYINIKESLKAKHKTVSGNDILIASIAIYYDYVLVTNNIKEFSYIDGLKIENWL